MAIGLSLANLSYLRVWSEILTYTRANAFWMMHPPLRTAYIATMLDVALLGTLIAIVIHYVRGSGSVRLAAAGRWAFLLALAVPLNALRDILSTKVQSMYFLRSPLFELIGRRGVAWLAIGLAVVGVVIIALWSRQLVRIATVVLLGIFPFTFLTFAQALWAVAHYNPAPYVNKPLAAALPVRLTAPRVLWIIFDEMDERLAFVDRDPSLHLPELDRLRRESLVSDHAFAPGPETQVSMPGYITGRLVSEYREMGASRLTLKFRGTAQFVEWAAQPNVFSRAREAGFNTAIVGWFHPYCRVFSTVLTNCAWWPMAMQYNSMGENLPRLMLGESRSLFETTVFSPFGQSLASQDHVRTIHAMTERTEALANDRSIGLALIHLPIPHAPQVYDRSTGHFTRKNSPISGYIDSLALVDRTLGELRRSMEAAGTWDSTALLVSSDHHYRESAQIDGKDDLRVPFILKLPGHSEGMQYQTPFNTVIAGDLLLSILKGEVSTPAQAVQWLNEHRSSFPVKWPAPTGNH